MSSRPYSHNMPPAGQPPKFLHPDLLTGPSNPFASRPAYVPFQQHASGQPSTGASLMQTGYTVSQYVPSASNVTLQALIALLGLLYTILRSTIFIR